MKKPLAIILLLFGALLVFFIAAFAYVLIFLNVGGFGLLINIAATLAAGKVLTVCAGCFARNTV